VPLEEGENEPVTKKNTWTLKEMRAAFTAKPVQADELNRVELDRLIHETHMR
jgi:hypothetical protein